MTTQRIGVMFERGRPPEELIAFAQDVERLGVDELWLVEDLGWGGAIAAAGTVLAVTDRIVVGIGIVPAPLRNPALLAMELATLERLHPGRLIAGIGHGVAEWMNQVGALVSSQLTLLEETIVGVRALLSGSRVQSEGRYVKIDGIQLVHPPATVPPLYAGVMKPKSLRLSGQVADGTILVEGTTPETVTATIKTIAAEGEHQLVVLAFLCAEDDPEVVRSSTAAIIAEWAEVAGVSDDEIYLLGGTDDQIVPKITALWKSGADSIVLRPVGRDPLAMITRTMSALGRTVSE